MIKFKKLGLKNFRSYEQLELSNLDEMGLTLISGTNGSGKSSIKAAIEYLLLDTTSDEIPLDELPRNGNTECRINCKLEMPNGDIVKITKYRNSKTNGNQIIVTVNGDDSLTTTDRRITKKNIDNLLGITSESLFSSTIFSQGSPSFVESAEKNRKDILYNFIDKEKYIKLEALAKTKVSDVEDALEQVNHDLQEDLARLDMAESQLEDWTVAEQQRRETILEDIENLKRDKLNIKEESTDEIENELRELESQANVVDDNHQAKKERLEAKLHYTQQEIKKVNGEFSQCKMKLNSIKSSNCAVLGRECPFLAEEKERLEEEYTPQYNEVEDRLAELEDKELYIEDQIREINFLIGIRVEAYNRILSLKTKLEDIKYHNSIITRTIESYDKNIAEKELLMKSNEFEKLKEETHLKIKEFKDQIEREKVERDRLLNERAYYLYWVTGYGRSGIPNMKMETTLETLEEETNKYLSKISDSIYVSIDPQKELKSSKSSVEKISYTVNHPHKSIKNYNSYSGGERQRVKLSDIFAFNSLLGKFNIMILDEALEGSIDDAGKSLIITLLKEKATELGSLFVVSHDDYIKDSFENVINVTKIDDISRIE